MGKVEQENAKTGFLVRFNITVILNFYLKMAILIRQLDNVNCNSLRISFVHVRVNPKAIICCPRLRFNESGLNRSRSMRFPFLPSFIRFRNQPVGAPKVAVHSPKPVSNSVSTKQEGPHFSSPESAILSQVQRLNSAK